MMSNKKPKSQVEYRDIRELTPLDGNPRIIKDDAFKTLCKSIKNLPGYFEARPIILSNRTGSHVIIAGNQRYKAAQHLKLKEVPTILLSDLSEEQEREIIIRDNVNNGEWDYDILANEWDDAQLEEWGVDIPGFSDPGEKEVKKLEAWVPDCLFPSNNIYDVPTLLEDAMADLVHNPFKPWGAEKRSGTGVGTYHFYVDDYRFQKIWDNPNQIIQSDARAIVEPNLSLYNETPRSYGLHLIYKKRWMARYLQSYGIKVFVDLNVSTKFYEDNLLGVPDGWNAFATRGYADRLHHLENEIAIARKVSGKDNPLMIIYGGGKGAREVAAKHNLIYIEQISNI